VSLFVSRIGLWSEDSSLRLVISVSWCGSLIKVMSRTSME